MIKKIIPLIIIIVFILLIVFNSGKNIENGNLSNMGLVVTNNGVTYYNKYEKGIFRVKNGEEEQLTDETAYSLNIVNNKIYYITVEGFNNVVIKCVDTNGLNKRNIATIYTSISKIYVNNRYIYYSTNETGKGIARLGINGENETSIVTESVQDFELCDNYLYYVNMKNQICKISLSDNITTCLLEEEIARKIQIVNDWIYYYNQSENALFRLNKDGSKNELVSVLINNETYNVSGKYVYYFDKENLKISRMQIKNTQKCDDIVNLSTSKTKINIANDEIYYLDKSKNESESYQIFRIKLNGKPAKNIQY